MGSLLRLKELTLSSILAAPNTLVVMLILFSALTLFPPYMVLLAGFLFNWGVNLGLQTGLSMLFADSPWFHGSVGTTGLSRCSVLPGIGFDRPFRPVRTVIAPSTYMQTLAFGFTVLIWSAVDVLNTTTLSTSPEKIRAKQLTVIRTLVCTGGLAALLMFSRVMFGRHGCETWTSLAMGLSVGVAVAALFRLVLLTRYEDMVPLDVFGILARSPYAYATADEIPPILCTGST
jgi:hypothetical protein